MARGERQALEEVADRLCAEFGYPASPDSEAEESSQSNLPTSRLFAGSLSEEDEQLIAAARWSLTRIARALNVRMPVDVPDKAVPALLDGAEMVMRSELAMGNRPSLVMPSFVFLLALPLVEQDEALELSKRTASLLEEAL